MKIERALIIAEKYQQLLSPYCSRIEIAGSIRRQRKEVGDIELVCIPEFMKSPQWFLEEDDPDLRIRRPEFIKAVDSFSRIKGNGSGKYCQIKLEEEINLDLFITTPEQWGLIFMIRTGSAAFSKRMVTEIQSKGYYSKDGHLWKKGEVSFHDMAIPCYEEEDFFSITGQEYYKPELRVL